MPTTVNIAPRITTEIGIGWRASKALCEMKSTETIIRPATAEAAATRSASPTEAYSQTWP